MPPSPITAVRQRMLAITLRTPAHPTVSRRFMLLRDVAGTPVQPPLALRYAPHEGDLVVIARRDWTWWQALSAEDPTPCRVRFKGRDTTMAATLAAGEALDELVLRYLQKYPGEWKALGVDARAPAEDVERAARGSAVISFRPA